MQIALATAHEGHLSNRSPAFPVLSFSRLEVSVTAAIFVWNSARSDGPGYCVPLSGE